MTAANARNTGEPAGMCGLHTNDAVEYQIVLIDKRGFQKTITLDRVDDLREMNLIDTPNIAGRQLQGLGGPMNKLKLGQQVIPA